MRGDSANHSTGFGITACAQTRQTNGFLGAINGLFHAAKRQARGYGRFQTMRTVISPSMAASG
jgi:hypothetical protein